MLDVIALTNFKPCYLCFSIVPLVISVRIVRAAARFLEVAAQGEVCLPSAHAHFGFGVRVGESEIVDVCRLSQVSREH